MFSKKSKTFPPGTFLAKPLRILAIIQLCVAFTLLISYGGYPFLRELYEIKSRKVLYEGVMGKHDEGKANRYEALPSAQKDDLTKQYRVLQQKSERPFLEKLGDSIFILVHRVAPFEKAWIVFSIVISILVLIKVEGAVTAAWLLPLLVTAYSIETLASGGNQLKSWEEELFPSEALILHDYLKEPLKANILEQRAQLLKGWNLYLIREWAKQEPAEEVSQFQDQVKEGEFRFNLERIGRMAKEPLSTEASSFNKRYSMPVLALFFLWNFYFAWLMNRRIEK